MCVTHVVNIRQEILKIEEILMIKEVKVCLQINNFAYLIVEKWIFSAIPRIKSLAKDYTEWY